MSDDLFLHSWNPADGKEWHFGVQPDGHIRHEYWTGSAWQFQHLTTVTTEGPKFSVVLDPAQRLSGRWVSEKEWHVYGRAASGVLVEWNYDPAAKAVKCRVI